MIKDRVIRMCLGIKLMYIKYVSKIFEIKLEVLIMIIRRVILLFEIWRFLVCGGMKIMICIYFIIFKKYIGIYILNKVFFRILKWIIFLYRCFVVCICLFKFCNFCFWVEDVWMILMFFIILLRL